MAASYKKLFKLLIDREMKQGARRKGGNQPGNTRKNEKRRRNRIK